MKLDRRSFLAAAAATLAAPAAFAQSAAPKQKFTVILDWFVNPDHAPLFAARYIGAFDRAGLDVALVPPTDPTCRRACSPPARPMPRSATRPSFICWSTRAYPCAAPAR